MGGTVSLRIQFKSGKIRTKKALNTDTFHAEYVWPFSRHQALKILVVSGTRVLRTLPNIYDGVFAFSCQLFLREPPY